MKKLVLFTFAVAMMLSGCKQKSSTEPSKDMNTFTYHKDVQDGASNEWLEPVSDEVYGKLK